jgi:sugar lactone lactonase YvrE
MYNQLVGAGDLTGDGRADLLARDSAGVLWLYRGTGSQATPFVSRTRIGAGWGVYNVLVRAGDWDGGGRADLFARDSAGVLWLYRGTGIAATPFVSRVKVATGWNGYNALL